MTFKVECSECGTNHRPPIVWFFDKFSEASEQVTFHHVNTGHERLKLERVEA